MVLVDGVALVQILEHHMCFLKCFLTVSLGSCYIVPPLLPSPLRVCEHAATRECFQAEGGLNCDGYRGVSVNVLCSACI